jgi:hypothetical protein
MKKESLNREGQGASCGSTAGDDTSSPEPCEQEPPRARGNGDPVHLCDVERRHLSLNKESSTW